ncbi:MAG: hypothetical protein ABW133_15900 [Polyangiaceae bacterium]
MRSAFLAVGIVAGALLVGCGDDDDDDDGDTAHGNQPVSRCEAFAATWCRQAIGCLVHVGTLPEEELASSQDQCTDLAVATIPCKRAVSIGESYEQCISDIRSMDCVIWKIPEDKLSTVAPPNTCRGIVFLSN